MISEKDRGSFEPLLTVLLALLFLTAIPMIGNGGRAGNLNDEPTRADGPIVNRSMVDITLKEDFDQLVDQYFNATGYGAYDLFYDPSYDWDEVSYPLKPFDVIYPDGFDEETTPIDVDIDRDFTATNFGKVTITCDPKYGANWNNIIYGQEWYVVTIIGRNRTGESQAQVRFRVLNVNDRPTMISDKDYFAIKMNEDSNFVGVNSDHDAPNEIFGDPKDPFDELTFNYLAVNDLAHNITVDLEEDGSNIIFTPKEDWACPYIPPNQRLKGRNIGGYLQIFAVFRINCSDPEGLNVTPVRNQELYVYVAPKNDVPEMDPIGEFTVLEDNLLSMRFSASDIDEEWDQGLIFGTNVTTSIYQQTQEQIEFQDEYFWDRDEGILEFMTSNDLVGIYDVEAFVRDYSTEEDRTDYPTTPYRVYSNFTLVIQNVNDPPKARIDQPTENFEYNTSSIIEFNAQRSIDIDIQHGDELNYTWTKNGEIFGYGPVFFKTIPEEGIHNVTVNVTDSEGIYSLSSVDVTIRKARVPGAVFENADMEREYSDNNTAVVISRTTDEIAIYNGGEYSLDLQSISSERNGAVFIIRVMFQEELDFLYTEELTQEPRLELFFLKPDFQEQQVSIDPQQALQYSFPVPFSNERYTRIEYDLRGPAATHPPSIVPLETIRKLDNGMGVEIKLTIVWMDDLGIKPDFELYAVASMKTTIKDVNGQTLEVLNSWDSSGHNTKLPQIKDAQENNGNGGESDFPWGLLIFLIILLVVIIVMVLVVVIFVTGRKKEEPEPFVQSQPQQSIEEMVFGEQQQLEGGPLYPDSQQLYGDTTQTEGGGLPPAQQPLPEASQQQTVPEGQAAPQQPVQDVAQGQAAQQNVPQQPPTDQAQQPVQTPPVDQNSH